MTTDRIPGAAGTGPGEHPQHRTTPVPATLADLITALQGLDELDPVDRARQVPPLIEAAKGVLARVRGEAFAEAEAAGLSQAEIGRRVGIGRAKVSEAIKAYSPRRAERA